LDVAVILFERVFCVCHPAYFTISREVSRCSVYCYCKRYPRLTKQADIDRVRACRKLHLCTATQYAWKSCFMHAEQKHFNSLCNVTGRVLYATGGDVRHSPTVSDRALCLSLLDSSNLACKKRVGVCAHVTHSCVYLGIGTFRGRQACMLYIVAQCG